MKTEEKLAIGRQYEAALLKAIDDKTIDTNMLKQYGYKPIPESVQVINDSRLEDLCSEYNNIILKRSKLSANQRALVQQRVQHLIAKGDIKAFKSIAEK